MDAAIDMIEAAIDCLSKQNVKKPPISHKVAAETGSKDIPYHKPRERTRSKIPSSGVLLQKRKLSKATKREKKTKNLKNVQLPTTDQQEMRKKAFYSNESNNYKNSKENRVTKRLNEPHMTAPGYARPTLSHRMKVCSSYRKRTHPANTLNTLPYVNCGSQGQSHNVGTIIQQELGNFKLNPLRKQPQSRRHKINSPSPEDVKEALKNVQSEIRILKKKA